MNRSNIAGGKNRLTKAYLISSQVVITPGLSSLNQILASPVKDDGKSFSLMASTLRPWEWVLRLDCYPTLVCRRPLGRVGQEMGYRLLWFQKDSRKVDIWFLELGLQWKNVLAFKGKTQLRSNPKGIRKIGQKVDFCQKLLRRAAESYFLFRRGLNWAAEGFARRQRLVEGFRRAAKYCAGRIQRVFNPISNQSSFGFLMAYRGSREDERGQGYSNSYTHDVRRGTQAVTIEEESTPVLVLDESCLNQNEFSTCLMGKVKEFSSLTNLKVALANEGFDNIKLKYISGYWVMIEFQSEELKDKFKANTKLVEIYFESFKIVFKGKAFWVRAKEVSGWIPDFVEEEDDTVSEDEIKKEDLEAENDDNLNYEDAAADSEVEEDLEVYGKELMCWRCYLDSKVEIKEDSGSGKKFGMAAFLSGGELGLSDGLYFWSAKLCGNCKTKSSSTSLNSLLEETNTFDNSLPEFETLCFDVEEVSSGSPTTHPDISLPEYEVFYDDHVKEINSGIPPTHSDSSLYASFIFDLSINLFPPADRSDFYEFSNELIPFISPPEYDCFLFKVEPNSGDLTKDVVEDIYPIKEPQVLNTLPTHPTLQLNMKFQPSSEYLFTYVVWIFLPFLVYLVALHYLLSLRNEDTIFDPGICNSHFSRPDVSHRYGTVKKFNTHRSHLNACPMIIHGQNNPILDVLLFHFYPL
nr:nucleotide-binding alpha-beta plait domain-containing protein [Tanacetum cinerariifolium]